MRGSGGTEGGVGKFMLGFALAAAAVYLLLDSTRLRADAGWISGMLRGGPGGHGWWDTTSAGVVFVPFLIGVIALFYDAKMRWAWWFLYIGLAIIVVEIFSRMRFEFHIKTTHLLIVLVLFGAGAGLILQSYRDSPPKGREEEPSG
jgi:hypothetical protein